MNKELPLEKLPEWAQEHIAKLKRQRDAAVTALNDFRDSQSESPIYYTQYPCIGEQDGPSIIKHYIQSNTINFNYAGVQLNVSLWNNEVSLSWSGNDKIRGAALVPYGYNQMRIVAKENLR